MYTRETGGVLTPQGEINHLESAAVPPEVTVRFTINVYTPRVCSTNVLDYKEKCWFFFILKKKEAIPACMTIVRTATCNIISPNPSVLTVRA